MSNEVELDIISDLHIFGPNELECELTYGDRTYYIGDNHEFKNILKKNYLRHLETYQSFMNKIRETKTYYVSGNHEVSTGKHLGRPDVLIQNIIGNRILFTHGDIPLWSAKAVKKWRSKRPGKSKFMITLIKMMNFVRNNKSKTELSEKKLKKLSTFASMYACDIIVIGHTHPTQLIDVMYEGVRIINVPRGKTTITIKERTDGY